MTGSRAATGLQYILLGLVLQLFISLLVPGMRYADYISMGITSPPFQLSQLAVPAVGVAIGALYLAGFRSIYVDRADTRWIRFARWPLIAAVISVAGTFAIALRTRFEPNWPVFDGTYWPVRAALDTALGAFAGLTFFLTFYDGARAQGRAMAVLAAVLGAGGSAIRYAPYLWQFDLSIYAWALATLSIALFLFQSAQFWRKASGAVTPAAVVLAPPPSR